MAKQLQYRRLVLLALLLGAAFAGLGYRLVDLQVLRYEELSAKAMLEYYSPLIKYLQEENAGREIGFPAEP